MEILFGNKGIYHYLDAKVGTMKSLEENGRMYQIQMLIENRIPYILPSSMLCSDGEVWLTHNTRNSYLLSAYLQQKTMDGALLNTILGQILKCSSEAETYLLNPADLVVHPEYMFFDEHKQEIRLICVPGHQYPLKQALKDFLEYLMPRFDHEDREGERFLYACYRPLADEWSDLSEFAACLDFGWKEEQEPKKQAEVLWTGIAESDGVRKECGNLKRTGEDSVFTKRFFLFALGVGAALALIIKYLFFDGTTVTAIFGIVWLLALIVLSVLTVREHSDEDEAMYEYRTTKDQNRQMDCPKQPAEPGPKKFFSMAKLIPLTNGAADPLLLSPSEQPVTVGRDKKSDYRVNAEQISRVHAKIYLRMDGLYIQDQDSTNGTFLNEKRLMAMQMYELTEGDVVGFANEEFFVSGLVVQR